MNSRIRARLSATHLRSNTERVLSWIPQTMGLIPMLKADAYGHGALETAQILLDTAKLKNQLHAFGVATLEEGMDLRRRFPQIPIWVFSETVPLTAEKIACLTQFRLSPVLHVWDDVLRWVATHRKPSHAAHSPYQLFFNTGMNRLGIGVDEALEKLPELLSTLPRHLRPECLMSHLASGEAPRSALTRQQIQQFSRLQKALRPLLPDSHWSLQNSGGLLHHNTFQKAGLTLTLGRPGLSLYGYACSPDLQRSSKLIPVMDLEIPVAALHTLSRGDKVGYGGRYRVRTASERIAILQAGYADGLPRLLFERGAVFWKRKKLAFRGVISMDLCAIQAGVRLKPEDSVVLFGKDFPAWQNALAIRSIPYELLTHVSPRVPRIWDAS